MIEEGSFDMKTLDETLNKVGATDVLEFEQFAEVLEILQDVLDGLDSNKDMDEADDIDGESYLEDDITEQILAQRKAEKDNQSGQLITGEQNEDLDDLNQDEEETVSKLALEIFDELKGSSVSLSVEKFTAWSDVKEMLDAGVFTEGDLDESLRAVGATNGELSSDQFLSLVKRLDDIAILSGSEDVDSSNEWNVKGDSEVLPNNKGFARKENAESMIAQNNGKNDNHPLDLSEKELEDSLLELYNDLKGSNQKLPVKSLLEWEDLLEMKQLDLIDDEVIHTILKKAAVANSEYLSLKEFVSVITELDNTVDTVSDNEDLSMHDIDEVAQRENLKEEDNLDEDTLKEIYEDLGETVTVESIRAWEDLVELREEGIIDEDTIEALLATAGITPSSSVTFEDFSEFVRLLEGTIDAVSENDSTLDTKDEKNGSGSINEDNDYFLDEEDVSGLTDEEFDEMAQEIFDALRGKAKKVSIKKFLAWDDLNDMINDGLVSKNEIELFAAQIGASDYLTFEQFKQVFNKIDEITSDIKVDDADGSEESVDDFSSTSNSLEISEIYDELKSGSRLTIQEFMDWEDVTDIVKLGILKKDTLLEMLSEVGAETDLSLEQFTQLFQLIEDSMSLANEGIGDLMTGESEEIVGDEQGTNREETEVEDEEEELSEEELEQMAMEIFNSLKGKKKDVVTAKKLMKWEGISDAISDGLVTRSAVQKILAKFDVANTSEFTFDQFKSIMDEIEEIIDSKYDSESLPELTTGKGFGSSV